MTGIGLIRAALAAAIMALACGVAFAAQPGALEGGGIINSIAPQLRGQPVEKLIFMGVIVATVVVYFVLRAIYFHRIRRKDDRR